MSSHTLTTAPVRGMIVGPDGRPLITGNSGAGLGFSNLSLPNLHGQNLFVAKLAAP